MPLVILQPCAHPDARAHFRDTIENDVMIDDVSDLLNSDELSNLKEIYADGKMKVWGVTPGAGGRNAKQWERMNEGDVTLLAQSRKIFASAVTTFKTHNKELAARLWDYDDKGQTWEYIYFLDEVKSHDIPYIDMNRSIGYKDTFNIQRFQVLDEEKSEVLLHAFDLESETYFPSTDIEEVYDEIQNQESLDSDAKGTGRKEQGKLQEIHVKKKKPRICSICGSELPANLLVAAHIKKRSKCSLDEKKDLHNVATPMCALGCDSLFEKGYIGVDKGKVVAIKPPSTNNAQSHIGMLLGHDCKDWKDGNKEFYEWHLVFHSPKS
jgi:hypothetical protein